MKKKRICYLLSHGFAARMVLHSALVQEVNNTGMDVAVLSPALGEKTARQFAKPGLSFHETMFKENKWTHKQLSEFRRYFREPIRDNAALWSRHLFNQNAKKNWIRWRARLMLACHDVGYRLQAVQAGFGCLDRLVHKSRILREELLKIQPDVIVATYPVSTFESSALLAAKELGIPTVGHLLSWDNITCKGRFLVTTDCFLSWGPIMNRELNEHYDIPDSRIFNCGVPHFDAHLNWVSREYQHDVLTQLGLCPDKPYLFFGMSAPIFAPREIDIVEWLAKKVEQNEFGDDMQMIIRPHPQNVTGFLSDTSWLPRLENLKSTRVGLNLPMLEKCNLDWSMEQDDLKVLVNLLDGCSVSLNSGSTLSIDSLMHDKPVVVTFFDAGEDLPWWQSARRIREFPHYQTLLATEGLKDVASFDELHKAIKSSLASPQDERQARQFSLDQECGPRDGRSASRVAEALDRITKERAKIEC